MALSIDDILHAADEHRAGDVYLMEGEVPRMKIRGQVLVFGDQPLQAAQMAAFWQSCGFSAAMVADGDSGLVTPHRAHYRVNLHKSLGRLAAVLQRLRTEVPTLAGLGLPDWLLNRWGGQAPGVILIASADKESRRATLAALLQGMNESSARHVVTLEDPAEFLFTPRNCLFTQREIGRDTPHFTAGLRGAMRQGPDVLAVADIRDVDTAQAVLRCAQGGPLVLATLVAGSVVEALHHLATLAPAGQEAASLEGWARALTGVLALRALQRQDGVPFLLCEHLENNAAVRPAIARMDEAGLQGHLHSGQDPASLSFRHTLVRALQSRQISEAEAVEAAAGDAELLRALGRAA